jgi:hypothetical protein
MSKKHHTQRPKPLVPPLPPDGFYVLVDEKSQIAHYELFTMQSRARMVAESISGEWDYPYEVRLARVTVEPANEKPAP